MNKWGRWEIIKSKDRERDGYTSLKTEAGLIEFLSRKELNTHIRIPTRILLWCRGRK